MNQRFDDNNIDFKKRKLTKYIKKEEEFFNFEDFIFNKGFKIINIIELHQKRIHLILIYLKKLLIK